MKYSGTKIETKRVEVELSDDIDMEIWDDHSLRTKIADVLLKVEHQSVLGQRDELFCGDADRVECAARTLIKVFGTADEVIKLVRADTTTL